MKKNSPTKKCVANETSHDLYDLNSDVVLAVKGVSKKFCRNFKRSLFYGLRDVSCELLGTKGKSRAALRKSEFWALQDISFEMHQGEAIGLVGKNGSGKTTLLRIIAGLINSDSGVVKRKGRITPLIALGAGFNPLLTGRENIYTNLSILGLEKSEINRKFDDVTNFADIGDAIDAPVQSYSSGMAARLGFACAINSDPDILLIDEVLAVGDIEFRTKCYQRLSEMKRNKVSFIVVSHNPESILSICDSAIYLKSGCFVDFGETEKIILKYEHDLCFEHISIEDSEKHSLPLKTYQGKGKEAEIREISVKDINDEIVEIIRSGDQISFSIKIYSKIDIDDLCIKVIIRKKGAIGDILFFNNLEDGFSFNVKKGKIELKIYLPSLGLMPGIYEGIFAIHEGGIHQFDVSSPFLFTVQQQENQLNLSRNMYYQPKQWKIVNSS